MVNTSLFTGLSGLRTHQRFIDVIGNNLANVSTPGFWGSRPTFSDILSFTVRPGSAPTDAFGGQNPMQIGLGSTVGSIDMRTNQGTFQDTGQPLDVALQGRGFFTLTNGSQSFFTRVGTFGLNADRTLVDIRTGMRVVGASGSDITIPVTDTLPPRQTSRIRFQGNLPAEVGGPLAEIVESSAPLKAGVAATKTTAPTTLPPYDLTGRLGQPIRVSVNGGAPQTVTFAASDFTSPLNAITAAELVTKFNSSLAGVEATAQPSGAIDFATIKLGEAATLRFSEGAGATGLLGVLGLNSTQSSGSETTAVGTTDLSELTARVTPYQTNDQIEIAGNDPDGSSVSATFTYGVDGTTLDDMIAFINATFDPTQVNATLTEGKIRMTTIEKGPASLRLSIGDAATNPNTVLWPDFDLVQDGKGPDTATTAIEVIDSLGRAHQITLTMTRSTDNNRVWNMAATSESAGATVVSGLIENITFNADGSFSVIGSATNTLSFSFADVPGAQSVQIDLGTQGSYDGVAMLGSRATVAAVDQDGFTSGSLVTHAFDEQGRLLFYYTNGQTRVQDTLRVTVFPNESGLLRIGDTMFTASPNSDDPIFTTAGAAGAGSVKAGSLENSNVDIAEEFVRLIEAQRGFQANSRVITTTDEILAELVNIVR